jgi:arylamine N-acetyltransferase
MATYSSGQIDRYFSHVGWKADLQPPPGSLAHLQELMKRQLATVPFESLSLHYSATRRLSLDPEDLFHKIVDRGMGGYCMECNTFFGAVLRSLGYTLINAGARVSHATAGRPGPGYGGWSHMVNIVIIDDQKYLVDVAFGANGTWKPLPLIPGYETTGTGTQKFRILYTALHDHTDRSQRVWVYSYRESESTAWVDGYAVNDIEFLPDDFEVMNVATMSLPTSFFVQNLLCLKLLLDEETEPTGWLVLHQDQVKKKQGTTSTLLEQLITEEQRVLALERWFNIRLEESEKKGIRGLASELKPRR